MDKFKTQNPMAIEAIEFADSNVLRIVGTATFYNQIANGHFMYAMFETQNEYQVWGIFKMNDTDYEHQVYSVHTRSIDAINRLSEFKSAALKNTCTIAWPGFEYHCDTKEGFETQMPKPKTLADYGYVVY